MNSLNIYLHWLAGPGRVFGTKIPGATSISMLLIIGLSKRKLNSLGKKSIDDSEDADDELDEIRVGCRRPYRGISKLGDNCDDSGV